MDHGLPQGVLTMTEAIGTLMGRRLRLSEFEVDTVHGGSMKRPEADARLLLKSEGEDKTSLNDEVAVLTIS